MPSPTTLIRRRHVLAGLGASAFFPAITAVMAHTKVRSGEPLPPILLESYADQATVEITRLYAQELAKLGILTDHKPLSFSQVLAKVVAQKNFSLALSGNGPAEDRIDPDYYTRVYYSSTGLINIPGYSNPEYDRLALAQAQEIDPEKRKKLVFDSQRIFAEDMPSWLICARDALNPVNTALFKNYKQSRGLGLDTYHVAPYMLVEPVGNVTEINIATVYAMTSAHPLTERSANGRGYLRFIYDTLLRYDSDLNIVPWAAESFRMLAPDLYEITLRSGMKWHDGKPVTVEDLKFTIEYLLKWKPPFLSTYVEQIDNVEITSENVVNIKLKRPTVTFQTVGMTQLFIMPRHIWGGLEEKGVKSPMEWDAVNDGGLVGSGPFKFVGFQKDVDCYVVANRDHWTGGPKISGIHLLQVSNVEQLIGGMEAGNVHAILDGLTIVEATRLAELEGIELLRTPSATLVNFYLDNRIAPFNDRALRLAMYYALPKKKIIDVVLGGAATPARRAPLPPVFDEWISPDIPGDEYDIERAKTILAEAGYHVKDGRLIMK
ncbi:ABC transporter substrate-binding protein [Aquamicrobium terrae]|uniref:Peptide/nickel transport system substrate-binding protein n=1 Tax=Aquamicrobium terrae TaxID=1324945 RepID=A0ABV2N6S4_9HYPH